MYAQVFVPYVKIKHDDIEISVPIKANYNELVLFRPKIKAVMQSVVFGIGGKATGVMAIGQQKMGNYPAANYQSREYTSILHMGCWLVHPEHLVLVPDASYSGYKSGADTTLFNSSMFTNNAQNSFLPRPTRRSGDNRKTHNPSMILMAMPEGVPVSALSFCHSFPSSGFPSLRPALDADSSTPAVTIVTVGHNTYSVYGNCAFQNQQHVVVKERINTEKDLLSVDCWHLQVAGVRVGHTNINPASDDDVKIAIAAASLAKEKTLPSRIRTVVGDGAPVSRGPFRAHTAKTLMSVLNNQHFSSSVH